MGTLLIVQPLSGVSQIGGCQLAAQIQGYTVVLMAKKIDLQKTEYDTSCNQKAGSVPGSSV